MGLKRVMPGFFECRFDEDFVISITNPLFGGNRGMRDVNEKVNGIAIILNSTAGGSKKDPFIFCIIVGRGCNFGGEVVGVI